MSSCLRVHVLHGSELKTSPATSKAVVSLPSLPGIADGSNRGKFAGIEQVRSKAECLRVRGHVVKEGGRLAANSNLERLGHIVPGC